MIFYFSATGNSQYVAEKLASALGSRVISIGVALRDGRFDYDISGDDCLGFVLPTFADTLPGPAARFIEKLQLKGLGGQYVFGVFTCGASTGEEGAALGYALSQKGIGYNGSFDIVMPDNFILWSSLPSDERINAKLDAADKSIAAVIKAVSSRENGKMPARPVSRPFMPMEKISSAAGTSKFYATDECISCGLCERLCPMSCIKIEEVKPEWEGECSMCLACLHRCPKGAIEYDKQTLGKRRYHNPRCELQMINKY